MGPGPVKMARTHSWDGISFMGWVGKWDGNGQVLASQAYREERGPKHPRLRPILEHSPWSCKDTTQGLTLELHCRLLTNLFQKQRVMKFPNRHGCSLDDTWKVTVKRQTRVPKKPATGTPAVCDVGVPLPGSSGLGGGRAEGPILSQRPSAAPSRHSIQMTLAKGGAACNGCLASCHPFTSD